MQIARFMGPTWSPPGSCRSSCGPHGPCYQGRVVNTGTSFDIVKWYQKYILRQHGILMSIVSFLIPGAPSANRHNINLRHTLHISNHWDVFTHPCLIFNSVLTQQPLNLMTSSNGTIFQVIGHLCGEFTGHRWISLTKASDTELWCFLWFPPE